MKETVLKIRIWGERILRKKSQAVKQVTIQHREILSQMSRLMYEQSGVGLAAPQIGLNLNMIVVDAGSGLYKLINPTILKKKGSQVMEEGCLSVPGVCVKVRRARQVKIEAQDEFGKPLSISAEDLLACIFQHELDHLKGKLIVDYAPLWRRIKMRKKLTEFKHKIKDEGLSQSETESRQMQL